jgi:hypothetical protein
MQETGIWIMQDPFFMENYISLPSDLILLFLFL